MSAARPAWRLRRPAPDASEREDGQVLVLSLAYALLAIVLVAAVVSATAVHLERKRLLALADLAALAAADALDVATYYAADAPLPLDPDEVRATVTEYVAAAPAAECFTGLTVVEATSDDARTVRVTLRAVADVPLVTVVTAPWSDGIELVVTARARAETYP